MVLLKIRHEARDFNCLTLLVVEGLSNKISMTRSTKPDSALKVSA